MHLLMVQPDQSKDGSTTDGCPTSLRDFGGCRTRQRPSRTGADSAVRMSTVAHLRAELEGIEVEMSAHMLVAPDIRIENMDVEGAVVKGVSPSE